MFNKLHADHRYDKKPRPAQNVDINRCLVAVADWEGMLGVMNSLQEHFGAFAKFKNQMKWPVEVAEKFHHLRLMMVSVRFDTGFTFGDLCARPVVQKLWKEYTDTHPPKSVPGGRWDSQVQTALGWLHSMEISNKKVIMLCEVQCVLAQYRNVRLKMHEIYKVHRADDGSALYDDFCAIRTDIEKQKEWVKDGSTPHGRQCRDNRPRAGLHNTADLEGCLYIACRNGSHHALKALLAAPHAAQTIAKNSVWMLSACIGAPDHRTIKTMVQQLIDFKANVNQSKKENGVTALFMGCQEGHVDICEILLAKKASVNKTKKNGCSPLHIACQEGHVDVCELLLAKDADVNQSKRDGTFPLLTSCVKGRAAMCEILVANKADINRAKRDGSFPLYIVCDKGHLDTCKLLLANKANVNQTEMHGMSPLSIACRKGRAEVCMPLLEYGADVNQKDAEGNSLLVIACQNGYLDVCKPLLAKNADVSSATLSGESPLFIACAKGRADLCELLLANKAYPNQARSDGVSPLLVACENGHGDVCKPLVDNKANVNQPRRSDGAFPLHVACEKGRADLCKLLLAKKAFVNKTTSDGRSALSIARQQGNARVCELLITSKANVIQTSKQFGSSRSARSVSTGPRSTLTTSPIQRHHSSAAMSYGLW